MAAPVDPSWAFSLVMGWVTELVTVARVDRDTGDVVASASDVTAGRSPSAGSVFPAAESGEGPQHRVTWYVRGDQITAVDGGPVKGDTVTDADGAVYVVQSSTAPPGGTAGAGLWVLETVRVTATGG